jgi:hypothetical protein
VPVSRRRVLLAVLTALVIARSAVFVFWPQSHFDSDQAVTGLMATHLSELRAFPLFWYGQTYMLAVESWLAAPLFAIAGASVTALKLPLLAMNVAIAVLLFRGLTRDVDLNGAAAAFATLFFVLAPPITTAHFLAANASVEPLLYVLLLWVVRRHPLWMGAILGLGFLNREFTIYGALGLVVLDVARGRVFTREGVRRYALAFGAAATVWVVVQMLRPLSSAAGPGTTVADLSSTLAGNNLLEVARRLCFAPLAIVAGAGRLFTVHWPELFGLERQPLTDFGIESAAHQGLAGSSLLLVAVLGIPILRIASRLASRQRGAAATCDFCAYLVLVAAFSLGGYLVGRCGEVDLYTMRYELLSVLGAAALAGWYLRIERSRALLVAWTVACSAVFAISIAAHARLLAEYGRHPPIALKQQLITALDQRRIHYGYADFWVAYYVSFMTRERIVLTPTDVVKIRSYTILVDAHRQEAVRVSRTPCAAGEQVTSAFWVCKP